MPASKKFKVGEIVCLEKHPGRSMTVNAVLDDDSVECFWWTDNGSNFHSFRFDRSLLQLHKKNEARKVSMRKTDQRDA